jgi:TrmH family RNA methyltransferase
MSLLFLLYWLLSLDRRGKLAHGRPSNKPKGNQSVNTNISIVLVEPQGSGNVGSVARAMKNTGHSDLVLINPCDYLNNDAFSMACKADDILRNARVFEKLEDCVKETRLLIGTTRRMGKARYPVLTLQESVDKILEFSSTNRVSILFGREDRGLLNEEIPLCDMLIEIPTHEDCPSLNLSQAVFIVCYHLLS